MRTILMVVNQIFLKHAAQVSFVQYDDPVKTFTTDVYDIIKLMQNSIIVCFLRNLPAKSRKS